MYPKLFYNVNQAPKVITGEDHESQLTGDWRDFTGDAEKVIDARSTPEPAGPPFAVILTYRADTSTTQASDPGTGLVRWNADAEEDVTALYFDRLTADNNNDVTAMWQMVNPARLIIQEADLALNQQEWIVTAPAIGMPDWFRVPVTLAPTKGAPFKPKDQTRLLVFLIQNTPRKETMANLDYPRMLFHRGRRASVTVYSRAEEDALGPEWSRKVWLPDEPLPEPGGPADQVEALHRGLQAKSILEPEEPPQDEPEADPDPPRKSKSKRK